VSPDGGVALPGFGLAGLLRSGARDKPLTAPPGLLMLTTYQDEQ
jgi:hypothetical protein